MTIDIEAKQARLAALRSRIIDERVTPELAAQANNLVMGDGNPDAGIVFIGEAPGKKEDEEGLPFVGASGRFLDEMLAAAGMNRGDIYITNIVKYRPPNNRDPSKAEKLAFSPYLAEQLEIIDPSVIVTLGRHSMEYFLPDARIGQIHGLPVSIPLLLSDGSTRPTTVVPLYHPAAALYNGSLRQTLIDDFIGVGRLLKTR